LHTKTLTTPSKIDANSSTSTSTTYYLHYYMYFERKQQPYPIEP
jgi:hypothetical protein